MAKIKITQVVSRIGSTERQKRNLDALGNLTLRMNAKKAANGHRELSVSFVTESEEAGRLIRKHLDDLRQALAEHGTELRDVEII